MTVKNVWDEGATLPEGGPSGGQTNPPASALPPGVRAISAARAAGTAEAEYYRAAGIPPPPTPGAKTEDSSLSSQILVQAMKDRADVHTTLVAAREAADKAASESQKQYWTLQTERLKEIEERLKPPVPGEQMNETVATLTAAVNLFKIFKAEMMGAAPPAPKERETDGTTLIALKNIDLQIAQMNNNFNLQLEEMRDARQRETQKWEDEKDLKHAELKLRSEESGARTDIQRDAAAGLQDLVGSVIAGLDGKGASGMTVAAPPPAGAFACAACGKPVSKPPAGVDVAPCPACGKEHYRKGSAAGQSADQAKGPDNAIARQPASVSAEEE